MSEYDVKAYSKPTSPDDKLTLPVNGADFGLSLTLTRSNAIQMMRGWMSLGLLTKDDIISATDPEFKVIVDGKNLPTKCHALSAAIDEAIRLCLKEASDVSIVIEHTRVRYVQPSDAKVTISKL